MGTGYMGVAQKQSSEFRSSGSWLAPLNVMTASGIPQRDVVLAVVNAEPSDSDTSHIRIISESCKGRFLGFFLTNALLVPFITVVVAVPNEWTSTFDSEVG